MKNNILITLLGFMSAILSAHAENFQFQNIRAGGTGCPSDVTQIVMAPDLTSASIIFQGFESHVPAVIMSPKSSPYISILNCNLFLDIKLPIGQKLDSLEISYDMRGNTFLDRGVSGNFKSYLISSNGLGTERSQGTQLLQDKNWLNSNIDQEEDFTIQTIKNVKINSQCNGNSDGRVSIHLQHQLGSQILSGYERTNASGTITMDSSDLKGGVKFKAFTSACKNEPGTQRPGRNCRVIRVNGRAQTICQ